MAGWLLTTGEAAGTCLRSRTLSQVRTNQVASLLSGYKTKKQITLWRLKDDKKINKNTLFSKFLARGVALNHSALCDITKGQFL